MKKIAVLHQGSEKLNLEELFPQDDEIKCFTSISALESSGYSVHVIVLYHYSDEQALGVLKQLRLHAHYYLIPIFVTNENIAELADGLFARYYLMIDKMLAIQTDIRTIKQVKEDWSSRCLAYLYTRNSPIYAQKNWQSALLYVYPIIELFIPDREKVDVLYWLNELHHNDMIQQKELLDSYFCCSSCQSAHISYAEQCPECKSQKIQACDFIHCYSCGNIAPELEFFRDAQLTCSVCKKKLRHIGVDYDRPLENYICKSCNAQFTENVIVASCMICQQQQATEQLGKLAIYNYVLTDKGRRYIQYNIDYALKIFDEINYIKSTFFYTLIEWAINMQSRNSAYEFSLVCIQIPDEIKLIRIYALAKHLKKILRKTDMLTRIGERIIWVWLPNTPLAGAKVVSDNIAQQELEELEKLKINIFFSQDFGYVEDAKFLIAELITQVT